MSTRKYINEIIMILIIFIADILMLPFLALWFRVLMGIILSLAFVLTTAGFILSIIKTRKKS